MLIIGIMLSEDDLYFHSLASRFNFCYFLFSFLIKIRKFETQQNKIL